MSMFSDDMTVLRLNNIYNLDALGKCLFSRLKDIFPVCLYVYVKGWVENNVLCDCRIQIIVVQNYFQEFQRNYKVLKK